MTITRFKKRSLIALGSILLFVALLITVFSFAAKYLIQKYDLKLIGREISVESAYANPFTGYISFNGIRIFEDHSDSVFIAAESLSGNFELIKLLFKTYEIDNLHLIAPKVKVIQNKEVLNFNDIIKFYAPKHPSKKKTEPVHLNLLDMRIVRGEFYYFEKSIPVAYSVKKLDAASPGLMWQSDSMNIAFDFFSGEEPGEMKGKMVVYKKSGNYRMNATMNKYNLHFLEQYLKDLSNFGKFKANVDADFKASGNFSDADNIKTSGLFMINELHVGKNEKEDYAALKKFTLKIEELNPRNKKYLFDSVSLVQPYFKYELYDHLNNIEMMFGENGSSAEDHSRFNIIVAIGKYIEQLARDFFKSDYKINRLAIYKGNFKYNDYTLSEKFSVSANPVYFMADSIKRADKPVDFTFRAGIKPYGQANIFISINPKDSSDFDFNYNFDQVPITLFNPYLVKYTSFPMDRGTLELKGRWHVRNGNIQSRNRLTIIDPRLYKRDANDDNKHLPMHLITYLVREEGNVIDYDIPISGNLKSPKFHFKNVISDIANNLFTKPFHEPYILKVRKVENTIEHARILRWEMRQNTLTAEQDRFLRELSAYLLEDPKLTLSVHQSIYVEKEKEHIALYEAKKRFYLSRMHRKDTHLTKQEQEEIEHMSIKDSLFVHYLNSQTKKKLLFTVQDKCVALVSEKAVNEKFTQLLKDRETAFMNYFKAREFSGRIKMHPMEEKIPYNGFSAYRIDYKGQMPEELEKAFKKLDDLDNKSPRKKFKKDRDRRKSLTHSRNES